MAASTTVNAAETGVASVLVGEDTDLLVLLAAQADVDTDVWMLIPGRKQNPHKVYSSRKLQAGLGEVLPNILFFHAAAECDPCCLGRGKR